jgi:hypothetical protein
VRKISHLSGFDPQTVQSILTCSYQSPKNILQCSDGDHLEHNVGVSEGQQYLQLQGQSDYADSAATLRKQDNREGVYLQISKRKGRTVLHYRPTGSMVHNSQELLFTYTGLDTHTGLQKLQEGKCKTEV